jgi:tryptophan 2,3-dioxygenase
VSGPDPELTYGSYLSLERILSAQSPPDASGRPRDLAHHDEMLFVVIHQVYELWFKLVLHELILARDLLVQEPVPERDVPRIVKGLQRVHEIQRVMVSQLTVLETMSPVDFLAFRDSLGSASGFQSAQFRELEILAGLPDEVRFEYDGASFERRFPPDATRRFDELRSQPTLRDALFRWLSRAPLEDGFVETYLEAFRGYVGSQVELHRANPQLGPDERARVLRRLEDYERDCRLFLSAPDAAVHAACLFLEAYRDEPLLHWPNRLLDCLLEFEELLRRWRFRHARMVERMIGLRVGTGGSSGVDYLDATAGGRYRIFSVILQARSFLIPRRLLRDLRDPARYGFARDLS